MRNRNRLFQQEQNEDAENILSLLLNSYFFLKSLIHLPGILSACMSFSDNHSCRDVTQDFIEDLRVPMIGFIIFMMIDQAKIIFNNQENQEPPREFRNFYR